MVHCIMSDSNILFAIAYIYFLTLFHEFRSYQYSRKSRKMQALFNFVKEDKSHFKTKLFYSTILEVVFADLIICV